MSIICHLSLYMAISEKCGIYRPTFAMKIANNATLRLDIITIFTPY